MAPTARTFLLYTAGPLFCAGAMLAGALGIALAAAPDSYWRLLTEPLAALGGVVLVLCLLKRDGQPRPWAARVCLALGVTTLTLAGLEMLGRGLHVDFRKWERGYRALAPFYRKPDEPTGEGFWRRAGPLVWRGQVLRSGLRALGLPDEAYRDEVPVTVRYDRHGFRHETGDGDWEVAVAGDSFTELGHLPFADLFTSHLARLTGWRVRNLGVSHTGPLAQLSFLRHWGLAPATRHLMLVFYEGNDLEDLAREAAARDRFRKGRPLSPERPPQTSLVTWLVDRFVTPAATPAKELPPLAYWRGPRGEVPLTLSDLPPAAAELDANLRREFCQVLEALAALARGHLATPWLAFMPCKRRVLHGQIRFDPATEAVVRDWQPTDLPEWVGGLCAASGVEFVDLTPPLRALAVERGELPFNALFDTHLNAAGARVVGAALARALTVRTQPGAAGPAAPP